MYGYGINDISFINPTTHPTKVPLNQGKHEVTLILSRIFSALTVTDAKIARLQKPDWRREGRRLWRSVYWSDYVKNLLDTSYEVEMV